jgi:acetyl-CoA carboxylase biotin carboxyl carrier protein
MTREVPVSDDGLQSVDGPNPGAGSRADLVEVHKHAVELLSELDRPPRNLRIAAGKVSVDISWDDPAVPVTGPATVSEFHSLEVRSDRVLVVEKADASLDKEYLTSPCVGVFYSAREPGAEPFVAIGSVVQPGQQIGIVEAMKLMMPVEADRPGKISGLLKADGEPVEYAEPLFELETAEIEVG